MKATQASEVILIHAIEAVDEKGEILTYEERRLANEALEGEGAGSPLEAEVARAGVLATHVQQRAPWLWRTTQQFSSFSWRFTLLCALLAAFFGASVQVLDASRTFHVLSTPLLGLLIWNAISLSILLLGPLLLRRKQTPAERESEGEPKSSWGQSVLSWLLSLRRKWVDWRKPTTEDAVQHVSVRAMRHYWDAWPHHASNLLQAQCTRLLHLCTMAFCLSALMVAYSRGITKAYRATRESTFLGAAQVDFLLQIVFLPSQLLLGPLPKVKPDVMGGLGPAAPWIHHYAATLVLLVLLPRLALFLWSWLQSHWYTLRLPLSMDSLSQVPTLNIALASHTNVGKTSLARTLLRRDVGEVRDAEHVTSKRSGYFLLNTAHARLRLWDTPGFGDAHALTHNLREKQGWAWLRALQDPALRYDREAALSLRDEADLILYLVPAKGGREVEQTLRQEWEVLREIGCPVICLLNRLEGASTAEVERLLTHWRGFFATEPLCRNVLSLDAFSRSWEDERGLFEAMEHAVAPERRLLARQLREIWEEQHQQRHLAACHAMASALQELSQDSERENGKEGGRLLQARAQKIIAKSQGQMLELMGLKGDVRDGLIAASEDFLRSVIPDRGQRTWGAIIGGALSGLLSGIVTDVLAGGMTFFGGAAIGLIGGALGGAAVGEGYRRIGGRGARKLVWQEDFMKGVTLRMTMLYLAAASHGRAKGDFTDAELGEPAVRQQPSAPKPSAGARATNAVGAAVDAATTAQATAQAQHQARLFAAAEEALRVHWQYLWPLLAVEHDPKADKLWDKMLPGPQIPAWVGQAKAGAVVATEAAASTTTPEPAKTPIDAGCTALLDEALQQWAKQRKLS